MDAAVRGGIDAVVIGASAGGIEAMSVLLPALPPGLAAAVIVVQHLPRDRASLLVEVLAPLCRLPVCEPCDKDPVRPGTVQLAPADYHLLIDEGPRFALSTDAPLHFSRPSIDVMFESAAEVFGSRLLGIVLTGANEDGAAGLAAIRRAGGQVVVEDPATAQVPAMPLAAWRACEPPPLALPLRGIAELLASLR